MNPSRYAITARINCSFFLFVYIESIKQKKPFCNAKTPHRSVRGFINFTLREWFFSEDSDNPVNADLVDIFYQLWVERLDGFAGGVEAHGNLRESIAVCNPIHHHAVICPHFALCSAAGDFIFRLMIDFFDSSCENIYYAAFKMFLVYILFIEDANGK